MGVYRCYHIQADTIAMISTHGYLNNTYYSMDAIRWIDFVFKTEKVQIQHASNGNGERISGISVDGYCPETNINYQFHVSLIFFFMTRTKFV